MNNWLTLNNFNNFNSQSFVYLINNIRIVCEAKHREEFDGLPIDEWYEIMYNRIGSEPLIRLIWRCVYAMINEDIRLDEVLAVDPRLWVSCIQNNNLEPYYNLYN
jgi:hypothetical protein